MHEFHRATDLKYLSNQSMLRCYISSWSLGSLTSSKLPVLAMDCVVHKLFEKREFLSTLLGGQVTRVADIGPLFSGR